MSVKTFVIAEIGSCHENSLDTAYNLILTAKTSGANAVKAQYWSSSKRLAERRNISAAEPIYAKYKIPLEWLEKLSTHAEKVGIEFMCSTYLPQDIGVVAPYVQRFKVSAFESQDMMFLHAHLAFQKPIVVSVNPKHELLPRSKRSSMVQLLHCISKYPAPIDELGLSRIHADDLDGYSDHSGNVMAGALAVAAGARIIEAHLRLAETPNTNPDYPHSLSGVDFDTYVRNIRTAEVTM